MVLCAFYAWGEHDDGRDQDDYSGFWGEFLDVSVLILGSVMSL